MNILELDSYNLADAVKFHSSLNPRIWGRDEHLRPEVREKLLAIAENFQEFLGVPDLRVQDITISGSNAAYSYTKNSDIDLHLVVDMPPDPVYQELFNAKKYQFNDSHDIQIGGADVELYVQPSDQQHHSQGIYSVKNGDWIQVPSRKRAQVDDACVRDKVADLDARIHSAIESGDESRIGELWNKIKHMRQSGLAQHGEFGCENLAFKLLRANGCIQALKDAKTAAEDRALSLEAQKQPRQRVRYGFGESPDGVDPTTKMFLEEPATESPDGVNPTTAMFLTETDAESIVSEFIQHTARRLGIKNMPEIHIHRNEDWSKQNHSFGMYVPERHELHVSLGNRHLLDILRTTAHELCHCAQHEQEALPHNAGETGSDWENEAHAVAGIVMRDFADAHPEYFKMPAIEESASGYIPKNKREARDPRYSMAVTVDIKPGEVGRQANKLALHTGRNGEPGLLMKTVNLREGLDKPELTVAEIAKKHKVSVDAIKSQLAQGIKVEKEHTTSNATAREIALDHLAEFPDYYSRLAKAEANESLTQSLQKEYAIFESQDLFEIRMSPSNLRQEAAKTGALAGMEFEMIVPNVQGDSEDFESEPDYEHDERCRSIEDACQFFYDGDYNGRRDIERLREKMQDDFSEWLDGKIESEWDDRGEEYILEWVKNNVDEDEWNPDELENDARNEALEEFAANVYADPVSDYYQQARDEFREEHQEDYDESDWLDEEDLDRMSNIENAYSIMWPHWTQPGEDAGQAEISDVAQDFENAIGRDTWAADSYHSSATLRPSPERIRYVVEPDASLEPDNDGDRGLEFVSPPLPIDQILSDLNKVKKWAKAYGCYTNDSTGLHINISVPNYSRENLDFVKLALLMGDKYVLDAFGRDGNHYAKSALDIVKRHVRDNPEEAAKLLDKMKSNLDQLATKAIHSGITNKYTSINTKDGHIEFRSPGGDWLRQNFNQIENTLLRFTVAMSAALNPDAYREEYQSKLYKLLTGQKTGRTGAELEWDVTSKANVWYKDVRQAHGKETFTPKQKPGFHATVTAKTAKEAWRKAKPDESANADDYDIKPRSSVSQNDSDLLKIFSKWSAGELPETALRSFVKQAQLQRKIARDPTGGKKYWWRVYKDGKNAGKFSTQIELVATSEQEAKDKAAREWGTPSTRGFDAEPVRPYDESQPTGPMLGNRPSNPNGNYVIADQAHRAQPVYRYMAADTNDALLVLRQWIAANPGTQWTFFYDPDQSMGQPAEPQTTTQPALGLWDLSRGGFIDRHGAVGQGGQLLGGATQAEVIDVARRNGFGAGLGTGEVEIRRIPPQQPAQQDNGRFGENYIAIRNSVNRDEFKRGPDGEVLRFPTVQSAHGYMDRNNLSREEWRISDLNMVDDRLLDRLFGPQQQPAQQPSRPRVARWNIVNNSTGDVVQIFTGGTQDEADTYALDRFGPRFIVSVRPNNGDIQRLGNGVPNYYIKSRDTDEIVKAYFADDSTTAHEYLTKWKRDNNLADRDYVYGRVGSLPDAIQQNITGSQPAGGSRNALSQTDIENRLNWPDQTGDANYEVVDRRTQQPVFKFVANTDQDAAVKYSQILDAMGMPEDTVQYGFRAITTPIPGSTLDLQRQRAAAASDNVFGITGQRSRGPGVDNTAQTNHNGPWEIFRMEDGHVMGTIPAGFSHQQAEAELYRRAETAGYDPEILDVRPGRTSDQAQGGIIDVATDVAQNFPATGREHVGWRVLDGLGREVYRFSGVGNNQGDANRIAADWMRQNSRGGNFEVVPIWGEA